MQSAQAYSGNLEKELSDMREQVAALKRETHQMQEDGDKQTNQRNKAELQIVDLKSNLQIAKDEAARNANDLG